MRWLRLFFDPTGRVGRQAFVLGLLGMLGLSIAAAALLKGAPTLALALVPIAGELAVTALFHGPVEGLDTPTMIGFGLILAVRAYILACLCLKRLRDQGRTSDGLIVMVLVTLAVHVAAGAWRPNELDQVLPFVGLALDILGLSVLWAAFLILLAHAPSRRSGAAPG